MVQLPSFVWQGNNDTSSGEPDERGNDEVPEKKRKRARVRIGTDEAGKAMYKWASGYSRKELNADIKRIEQEYAAHGAPKVAAPTQPQPEQPVVIQPVATTPTFRAYAREWYELYKKPNIGMCTKEMYENVFKTHLFPEFGDTPIGDINGKELQRFIIQYDEASKSLIDKIAMTIRQVFRFALDDEVISKDPSRKLKPPPGTVGERKPLTIEAVKELMASAQGNPDGLLPMVLLLTGMRRGEVLGLRWDDINDGEIHVLRAAKFDGNHTYIGDTKTKAARRTIPVDGHLSEWLSDPQSGYVFGGEEPWTQSKYTRTWERIRKTIPILEGITAHVLRHTYTMIMRRAGVDSATAQYLLGHEDYQTTANVYTHIDGADIKEAQAKMGLLLPKLLPHV